MVHHEAHTPTYPSRAPKRKCRYPLPNTDIMFVPEQVFCTPKMAYFLRNNEPWAQLTERGNISIRELQPKRASSGEGGGSISGDGGGDDGSLASVRLTPSVSFLPVVVPHRAELSDTVAYVISMPGSSEDAAGKAAHPQSSSGIGGVASKTVLYCPDTDGWSGWTRSIRDWCEEVDVALLDATFYGDTELKGRDMSEVIEYQTVAGGGEVSIPHFIFFCGIGTPCPSVSQQTVASRIFSVCSVVSASALDFPVVYLRPFGTQR